MLRTRYDLEDDLEDDLECVQIDNYENSGPHCMEGYRMRRVERSGYCSFAGLKLRIRSQYLFSMMSWSLLSSLVAIEDFFGQI